MVQLGQLSLYCFFVFLFSLVNPCFGQYQERIASGRPGQAIGATTVGARVFQIQSGLDLFHSEYKSDYKNTGSNENNVIRYGVTELFEVGLGLAYQTDKFNNKEISHIGNGLSELSLRIRSKVLEETNYIPAIDYQFNFNLPGVSDEYSPEHLGAKFTMSAAKSINDNAGFTTNFGVDWDGNGSTPTGFYILNLGTSLGDNLGSFVEFYGFIQGEYWTEKWDAGFSYLIGNNLQVDLYSGMGNNEGLKEWFVSTGVSWRTRFTKK